MKLNRKAVKEKWHKMLDKEGVEFLLRPFPMSQGVIISKDMKELADFGWKRFDYCVKDWKGLVDEDSNEPIECNKENKKFIFDYVDEIVQFIATTINEIPDKIFAQKKI